MSDGKVKKLIGLAAIKLFFTFTTWALTSSYMEDYNFISVEPENVTVIENSGAKGLFTPPSHMEGKVKKVGPLQSCEFLRPPGEYLLVKRTYLNNSF
ncbi:hypothetical protein ABE021_11825 [Sporosarcina gallistercoris]|uniref:hypothetical protein n=1 Tax=Sporosarcina gallistercoris TaxID=2762245 RepID=UPI003D2BBDFE